MEKVTVQRPEIKLVGITTRTNNADEGGSDPSKRKIGPILQRYFQQCLGDKIRSRKNPGTTFRLYTNYESDWRGDYTYFVGEEVIAFEEIEPGFQSLTIPSQDYVKLTHSGSMPTVCIQMWQAIWAMGKEDFEGERTYLADFEVHDQRSLDPQNTTLDIYIGVKKRTGFWVGNIQVTPLIKAFSKFEKFRKNDETEQQRAGIIQAFEYCFELAWKIMKRLLEERGKIGNSPREVFRMAALEGFIVDPEAWFEFLKKRNITLHSYNEAEAEQVILVCGAFSFEMKAFLKEIGLPHDQY